MKQILQKAKEEFFGVVDNFGSDPYHLLPHVPEVEKWAKYMISKYPKADEEVILLSVWLHDIGHYPIPTEIDHAIRSEDRAREFLERENYPKDKMDKVLHCVRAHRCRDIAPETLEAKILALIDSASHITTSMYFDMAKDHKEKNDNFKVYEKMKRDMRDLASFPEIEGELKGLFEAWENLIRAYEKINLE